MTGWRLATVLGVLSAGVLASEPAESPEAEFSLELLEFLGEYGNEQGELNLPEDFDSALTTPSEGPVESAAETPVPPTPVPQNPVPQNPAPQNLGPSRSASATAEVTAVEKKR